MTQLVVPLSAASQVAADLRAAIIRGDYPPRTPLREARLAEAFGVSRNTLRESLKMLVAERLVEQTTFRGSVVATPSTEEIRDIYRVRRTLELSAVEHSAHASDARLNALADNVTVSQAASAALTWRDAGTASLKFHQDLVALLGSTILDNLFRTVAAQLRLAFLNAPDEGEFEAPWVERDRLLCQLICEGRRTEAARQLSAYLDDSERLVLDMTRRAAEGAA